MSRRPCPCREGTSAPRGGARAPLSPPQFNEEGARAEGEGYSPAWGRPGTCDVCLLVDGDAGEKEVRYCSRCDARICRSCTRDWGRRARAALLRKKKRGGS